ncbi:MAG: Hpt domain-containing protein, partial [Methanogenium sp.]|nr:Hpt domain-containing protein [Methanogenium sp.]
MLEDETYRKLFVAESRENHENIVSNLLMLEEGKDDNAIDEIFRSAHTLKGMSASMGYSAMEHLCHAMENVFHSIRNNELSVSPGLIDLLLSCTDRIEEMLDDVESGGDSSSIISEDLVTRLNDMDKSSLSSSDTSTKESIPGIQKYHVTITVDESCNMKDIRAMLVFQNLENIGEILNSSPSPEQIDAGEFDGLLNLEIETDAGEEALRSALSLPEISITDIKTGSGDAEDLTEQSQLYEAVSEDVDDILSGEKYRISVNVDDSCNMKDVRAMLVINNLKDLGNIISTTPSAEKIDNGEFNDTLEVIISSDAGYEALYAAAFGTEIANVDITVLDDETSDALNLPGSVKQSDKTT